MSLLTTIEIEFHSRTTAAVALRGEHDLYSIDRIVAALERAGRCPFVLVDLLGATFIDSSVIHAVLSAADAARRRGGALELAVAPASPVRRAFDVTGIPALVPMHDGRGAALASLEGAAQLEAHHPPTSDLRTVAARIEHLEAKTENARARLGAPRRGIVVRARVTDATGTTRPRPHAA